MQRYSLLCPLCFTIIILLMAACEPVDNNLTDKPTLAASPPTPEDWMYRQRAYPHGRVRKDIYLQAMQQWQALRQSRNSPAQIWESVGPMRIGGRITSLAVDPSNEQTIYIGAASGGVFKSTDGGQQWQAIFDQQTSLSVGDLAVAPSAPQTLYVGTGEANAGGGSLAYDGSGIYRSKDGGASWTALGLENSGSTGKVIVHPQNPDLVYAATMGYLFENNRDRGLYRTRDGGEHWEQVLYVSDSTGVIDLAMHPEQPDILFAATWERVRRPNRRQYGGTTSAVYRSKDGGDQWEQLPLPTQPGRPLGRIGLAVSPVAPHRLYASVVDGDSDVLMGIYSSDDLGESWSVLPMRGITQVAFMWWFGKIYADPLDADRVYLCGLELYQYDTGAEEWLEIMINTHVDQHALFIEPKNRNYLLLGNDGGLYRGTGNFRTTWTHFKNLPITQFYTSEIDHSDPERLFGGTQDNGSLRRRTDGGGWELILGGDGFVNLVDPTNADFVYAESQYGNLRRSTTGGNAFSNATPTESLSQNRNWHTPVILDPQTPSTLYYGAQKVYRSTDRAQTWEAISPILVETPLGSNLIYGSLTSLAVSPADTQIIYAGADDGSLFVSSDAGLSWDTIDQTLPDRWITRITTHPTDPDVAYVTLSGYRWNEYLPHVLRTDDRGQSWTDLSAGLPEVPANDLVINPEIPTQLFLATDAGVFISNDEGFNWDLLSAGLPKVVISDLSFHAPTQTLVAGTYGRSMYRIAVDELPLSAAHSRPDPVKMMKAYPNPFREQTEIVFELTELETIEISVYTLQGQLVETLFRGELSPGVHRIPFATITAGSYLCRIVTRSGSRAIILSRS